MRLLFAFLIVSVALQASDDVLQARSNNDLAVRYQAQARYSEAEALYRQAIGVWRQAGGPVPRSTVAVWDWPDESTHPICTLSPG